MTMLKSTIILELHKANPAWRGNDIARAANCSRYYVTAVLGRHGLLRKHKKQIKGKKLCVICRKQFAFWHTIQNICSLRCYRKKREIIRKRSRLKNPEKYRQKKIRKNVRYRAKRAAILQAVRELGLI